MKLTERLLCGWLLVLAAPVEGRSRPPPSPVFEAAGRDALLPCHVTSPVSLLHVETLAWYRWSGASERTVYVHRGDEDMSEETAEEYRGRTKISQDGSLQLSGVRRSDTGEYRCVVWTKWKEEAKVFLTVVQVEKLEVCITRTASNQLVSQCETRVWNLSPGLQLLDAHRNLLPVNVLSSNADDLYSVQVKSAAGTLMTDGTLICRLDLPEVKLVEEKTICITDDFRPEADKGHEGLSLLAFFITLVVVVFFIAMAMGFKVGCNRELQISLEAILRRTTNIRIRPSDSQEYSEHAELSSMETTGASQWTAHMAKKHLEPNGRPEEGVWVSERLAEVDLEDMKRHKDKIISVGQSLHVHPALIAAIISKQSQGGRSLKKDGFGKYDKDSYGLMQINRNYHVVKLHKSTVDHIEDGTTYLIHLLRTLTNQRTGWTTQQLLKGALVAYISGMERVPLEFPDDLDSVTPTRDFSNDVIARAKWYAAPERFGG